MTLHRRLSQNPQGKASRTTPTLRAARVARALLYDATGKSLNMFFSRVAACWLVVLVLAPFTAPFPTCDFATLFGGSQTEQSPVHLPVSVIANDSVVASVPAISGVGRIRLTVLAGAFPSAHDCFRATTLTHAAGPAGRLRDHAGLAAILRV